jgi:glycosyltransferase involved in cell wall biosynthesis
MRWAWSFETYSAREEMGAAKRLLLPHLVRGLRQWDVRASRQPDHFIANSRTVATRIHRVYGRLAEVIHPPINLERFRPSPEQDDYYIVLARLVSYKRIDLAVRACTMLGRRLLVIGDGPDRARLMAHAGPTVSFLGLLSDEEVEYHAARCRALIFPGEEDFGMAPLEIAAAGRPTIAYRAGGAVETIIEGVTGIFFDRQEAEDLAEAIARFERIEWNSAALRRQAECFSTKVFDTRLRAFLAKVGAPVPEDARLPFNAAARAAPANVGIVPVQEGIPA